MDKITKEITVDRFNPNMEILYGAGNYAVHVTEMHDSILDLVIDVYGVYNVVTGVREAETRRLINAIAICKSIVEISEDIDSVDKEQIDLFIKESSSVN